MHSCYYYYLFAHTTKIIISMLILGLCKHLNCISVVNESIKHFFTARKRSLRQGNIFAHVCHSVHRGVCLSACWNTTHPQGPGTPPAQCMLGDTVNKRSVCILLECNLVIIFISTFIFRTLFTSGSGFSFVFCLFAILHWQIWWSIFFRFHSVFDKSYAKQECILVGCVPPASVAICWGGVCVFGLETPAGCGPEDPPGQTPSTSPPWCGPGDPFPRPDP